MVADVVYGSVTIKDVRLIDGARGKFVGLPSRPIGEGRWHEHVTLDEALKAEVLRLFLDEERAAYGMPE